MKTLIKIVLILCVLIGTQAQVFAQIKVHGTVSDQSGVTLPGVRVMIVGHNTGTVTDIDGNYSLPVKNEDAVLQFSFVGFNPIDKIVGKQSTINVVMQVNALQANEVVVVGYGSMNKSDITGSITSISAETLENTHSQSLISAMQGQAAGVYVSTTSAAPGGASSIRIRGTNSLLADSNPLYVVDGFPVDASDINSMNMSDVASIEILKDAASTAIYGSRGANGVILIQTSTGGKSKKPKFKFSSNFGVQEIYRDIELLNGQQFAEVFNEYQTIKSDPELPYYDGSTRDRPLPQNIGEGTDWFDQITQTGFIQNYNLSVSGGSDAVQYRVGGAYYTNKGVIKGGNFDRYNLNVNNKFRLTDWFTLQTNIALSRTDTDGSGDRTGLETKGGTLNNAIKMSPVINVYDENGNYNANSFPGAHSEENPLAYANEVLDNIVSDNVVANLDFNFRPIEGLDIQAKFGANIKGEQGTAHLSTKTIEGAKKNGEASISNLKRNNLVNEYIANYKTRFKKHRLFFTGALSLEYNDYERSSITGTGLSADDLSYAGIASADIVSQPLFAKTQTTLMSLLGRVNYIYDDRLFLTLTNRADANSGFSEGNKWGNFPSVAAAWTISNEDFMKKSKSVMNNLKLRASWGVTGNSKIGTNRSLSLMANDRYPYGDDIAGGVGPSTIGNPNLKWETTEMYNLALDFGFLNNTITFTAEAYYKYTSDMIMSYDIPSTAGYKLAYMNVGELENKGLEFALNALVINRKDFQWTIGGNISFNRDKVMKLYNNQPLEIDIGDKQTIRITEGRPIREFQGKEVVGIFRDQNEIDAYTWTNPETGAITQIQGGAQPGDIKYRDVNNDGVIDADDSVVYGSAFPKFMYGITTQLKYKGFALDIFLTGSEGNYVQNRTLSYLRNTKNIRNNLSAEVLDRWTVDNIDADIPRLGSEDQLPNIEDASYLRIQNVSLSYLVPIKWSKKNNFNSLTIYASIDNVYVWTDYSGWDPDVNSSFGGNENINVGSDTNSYPRPRIYRFGFNLKF